MTESAPSFEFHAFLSHSYKAREANEYFYDLFSKSCQIVFDVDKPNKPTSVTRLERFIRNADAFIGFYAAAEHPPDQAISRGEAIKLSRYFRLELDIAFRFRTPGIIFVDKRFGNALEIPTHLIRCPFHPADIVSVGGGKAMHHSRAIETFLRSLEPWISYRVESHSARSNDVGILVPESSSTAGYSDAEMTILESAIAFWNQNPVRLDSSRPDSSFFRKVSEFDWIAVELGGDMRHQVTAAFLQGLGVPMMRLVRGSSMSQIQPSATEAMLLSQFDVGYPKDIVRWSNPEELQTELERRLLTLHEGQTRIGTREAAFKHFGQVGGKRLEEKVFVSYSGNDLGIVFPIIKELKERFRSENVFDYKDQESLTVGKQWQPEIYEKLRESQIAIPILTESYLTRGHCMHELDQMVANATEKKQIVIPVKLIPSERMPEFLKATQCIVGEGKTSHEIVEQVLAAIPKHRHADFSRTA